jgi:HJR/Mrr/RecB family endonuclease
MRVPLWVVRYADAGGTSVTVAWEYHWIFGLIVTAMILSLTSLGMISWAAYYLATAHRREARRQLELLRGQGCLVEATTHISDAEFAQILAEYFRQVGYSVRTTQAGRDYRGRDCRGANLRLLKYGRSIAVRIEKHTELLGVEVAQDLITTTAFYDADDTWVLTTSSFTNEARELADRMGVRLIDGAEIGTWFTKLTDEEEPAILSRSAGRNVEMEIINEARKRAFWHLHPDSEPFDRV